LVSCSKEFCNWWHYMVFNARQIYVLNYVAFRLTPVLSCVQ
jgi:hypothetical protein